MGRYRGGERLESQILDGINKIHNVKTLQGKGLGFSNRSVAGEKRRGDCKLEKIYVVNQPNATHGLCMTPYSDHQLFF